MGGTAGMRACLVRTPASSRRAARQAEERLPSLAGGLCQRSSLWGGAPVAEVDGDSVSRSQELVERGCSDVVSKPAEEETIGDDGSDSDRRHALRPRKQIYAGRWTGICLSVIPIMGTMGAAGNLSPGLLLIL